MNSMSEFLLNIRNSEEGNAEAQESMRRKIAYQDAKQRYYDLQNELTSLEIEKKRLELEKLRAEIDYLKK